MASLTTLRTYIEPNNWDASVADSYSASWALFDSQTTDIVGDVHRVIHWDTGQKYAGRETWVLWKWRPVTGGAGRQLNFHTAPTLPGGWWWGDGVSPIALDYYPGTRVDDNDGVTTYSGLHVTLNAVGDEDNPNPYHFVIADEATCLAAAAAGTWFDIIMKITWGNKAMATKGALTIWRDGMDTPVVNVSNTNTHYYSSYTGSNPGGGQRGITLWQGGYWASSGSLGSTAVADHVAARVGRTLAEALNDGVAWPMTLWSKSGQDTHPRTSATVASRTDFLTPPIDSANFAVPAVLGGGGGGGVPAPDPTLPGYELAFGNTSVSGVKGSGGLTLDALRGSAYQVGQTMDSSGAYFLLHGEGLASQVSQLRAVLYDMSGPPSLGGVPVSRVAQSSTVNLAGDLVRQWVSFPWATTRLTQGAWYSLQLHAGGVASTNIEWDATSGYFYFKSGDAFADGAAALYGAATSVETRLVSSFVVGTSVSAVTNTPRVTSISRTTSFLRAITNGVGRIPGLTGGGV